MAQKSTASKTALPKTDFTVGELVVYPNHGVGEVLAIEKHEISGVATSFYVISFKEKRMTLRLPVSRAKDAGLRRLSSAARLKEALGTLQGKAKIRRTMWSRRAQEYEAKINSGDLVLIAEVVRDLYRNPEQTDQSYSERQIYQAALERLAREYAAVEKTDEAKAIERLEGHISKARGKVAA